MCPLRQANVPVPMPAAKPGNKNAFRAFRAFRALRISRDSVRAAFRNALGLVRAAFRAFRNALERVRDFYVY